MRRLRKLPFVPILALLIFASAGVFAQKGHTTGGDSQIGGGDPPSAPTNLKADGTVAAQEIVLTWNSSGGTGFIVLRSASSNGTFSQIAAPTATTYTDTGLPNGTTYYYEVEATNSYGASGPSNQASAITKPATPTGLSANGGTAPQTVALSWSSCTGASSYSVSRSGSSGGPFTSVGSSSTTSYSDTTAVAGTTYFYQVAAVDASGASSDSSTASALTLPAAPTLSATGGDTVVSLSWNWVQSENGYTITRSTTPNGTPTATFNPTGTTLIDDGLADGNTYYYKIYASNATGNGPSYNASAVVSGTIPNSGGGLTGEYGRDNNERVTENDTTVDSTQVTMPPTGISASTPSPGAPTPPDVWSCRWSGYIQAPVSGSYNFLMPGSEYEQVTVGSTEVAYVSSIPYTSAIPPVYSPVTLTAGQVYLVVIQFMAAYPESTVQLQWQLPGNQSYEAVASNYLSPAVPVVSTPAELAVSLGASAISLAWDDSQQVGCDLYRASQSGSEDYTSAFNPALIDPQQGDDTYSYQDGSVEQGQEYFYTARGAYSNPVTGDLTLSTPSSEAAESDPLPAPVFTQVMATSSSSIRVYFQPVPGATSYNIYRSTTSGGETVPVANMPVVTGNEHFYDDSGLTAYQDYYYQVTAVAGSTESASSPEDSHYPNPNAIPWNGTNAQILAAALGTLNSEPGLPYSVPLGNSSICTPDGQLLEDGPAGAAIAPIDVVNWKKVVGTQTMPVIVPKWVTPVSQATKTTYQAGAYRRVLSNPGSYSGTTGWISLPSSTDSTNFKVNTNSTTGNTDVPQGFVGLHSGSIEVDAGVEFNPTNGSLPDRWSPYINIYANGQSPKYPPIYPFIFANMTIDKSSSQSYIYAPSQVGNLVFLGVFIDADTRTLRFYCFAVDENGEYLATSLNAAAKLQVYGRKPISNVDMKRVTGIPQSITKLSNADTGATLFDPAPPGAVPPNGVSFYASGSIFNSTWLNANILSGGNYVPWSAADTNLTFQTYFTPNNTVQVSGDQSSGNGELDAIHH